MDNIRVIPFGGVREEGKNLYAVEVNEEIYILDCGMKVPETDMLGVDGVIPDFSYLVDNKKRIAGIFLTHGHTEAIGALPYLLQDIKVPVFGSKLTIELAKLSVQNIPAVRRFKDFHVVNEKTEIDFKESTIKFFNTTHSIPESLGIVISTDKGNILYTGDFKFDQSAKRGYKTNLARLAKIGEEGVLLLMSDATNADSLDLSTPEYQIQESMEETFRYCEGRIIVGCVSANLQRMQQIFNAAHKAKRKVVVLDHQANKIIQIAIKLKNFMLPEKNILVSIKNISKYQDDELVILVSGKLGTPIKNIQRMAKGTHRQLNIKEGDLVYLATNPPLSMELFVAKTENMIYRSGGTVKTVSDDFFSTDHADPEQIRLLLNLLKPKYLLPIQGEYRQLKAQAKLGVEVGIPEKNTFITKNGEIIEYKNKTMNKKGFVSVNDVLIDGFGVGDVGNIVLRDRKVLSEDGIFVVVVTIDRKKRKIISKPQISSRGFVYVKASRNLFKDANDMVSNIVTKHLEDDDFEWSKLKIDLRDQLSRYLFEQTRRRPVILPVIMEVNQNNRHNKHKKRRNREA